MGGCVCIQTPLSKYFMTKTQKNGKSETHEALKLQASPARRGPGGTRAGTENTPYFLDLFWDVLLFIMF